MSRSESDDAGHAGLHVPVVPMTQRERAADYALKDEEGPMASAFNICALAIDWRTTLLTTSDESEGMHIPDPGWLLAVNAVSLILAVISNVAQLGQMTDRIRFNIGAPVTIVGWYSSSFMLIGLVAACPSHLPLPAHTLSAYSQAYYYACYGGALYFILSTMLSITACGVWFFHLARDFKLTLSQRSLMIQTVLFLGYLLAAGAVYSRIEGWDYLDAVYYVNVTLFTIGFGDFAPKTHLGRSLFFPMAFAQDLHTNGRKGTEQGNPKGDPATGTVRLGGVEKSQVNANSSTELQRREHEFNVMRRVQKQAANYNRMEHSLFLVASFLSVAYQLVQTDVRLWALIALPTLTVLIGAVGDAVSNFVGEATLWLGQNLPESTPALHGLKSSANKKKKRDGTFQDAKPPGFMSNDLGRQDDSADEKQEKAVQGLSQEERQNSTEHQESKDRQDADAAGESYRLYLVIKEMKNVVQHLDSSPPRKYAFAEWSWFMKLIYEDEATPDGHRRQWHLSTLATAPLRDHQGQAWSWMGQESPLMSMEDEPKWVLVKLMEIVEREVKKKGDLEMEKHEVDDKS